MAAPNDSHIDGNHMPTALGVIGTLGTADLKGTALTLPVAVDPKTGAWYVNDISETDRISQSPASPAVGTIGTTSAQLVAANASRTGLSIVNTSANTLSLGLGTTAIGTTGITLYPHGNWLMDAFSFGTQAINAIASGTSSLISVQEWS